MSELADRLRTGLMAVAAFVRGNADAKDRMNDALDAVDEAVNRIAELEAERDRYAALLNQCEQNLDDCRARIAELEAETHRWQIAGAAEIDRLNARIAELEAERDKFRDALSEMLQGRDARIAELEAELAMSRAANGELIAERLRGESAARIAELEAERNRDRETLAQWMIIHSYATGHGDTTVDLLGELKWQVQAERARIAELEAERLVLHDKLNAQAREHGGERIDAAARIAELEADRNKLRKALKPFTDVLRAAHAALSTKQDKT